MTALWKLLTAGKCSGFQLAGKSDADMLKGRDELVRKSTTLLVQLHH